MVVQIGTFNFYCISCLEPELLLNVFGTFCSNGSGKSSLAMAALWALTGSLDNRRVQDAKTTDVVNDESKVRCCLHWALTLENSVNSSSSYLIAFFFRLPKSQFMGKLTAHPSL